MKRLSDPRIWSRVRSLLPGLLAASLALPLPALPASLSLATVPLATATTTQVLPNLMFILDNSGSMGNDYTPDYITDMFSTPAIDDRQCRDSADGDGTIYPGVVANGSSRVLDTCVVGDPPYMSSDMNYQYYNPAIRYRPGVNADGSSKPSQSSPTSVVTDAYNKQNENQLLQSKTSVDLTVEYPDRIWCTKTNPTTAEKSDPSVCRKNSDYLYPNATFRYGRTSGSPDQMVTANMLSYVLKVSGAPYYYSIVPSEYCDSADLKNCIAASAPSGVYTFPAKSRWCSDTALTSCQSIKTSTYKYPRYVGSPGAAAVAAQGSMGISSSKNKSVTSIKVNGVEILGSTVSWGNTTNNSGFASAIANAINSYHSTPEYTATVSGSTITITSTTAAGASANGAINYSGSSSIFGSTSNVSGGVNAVAAVAPYAFARTDIIPSVASYPKSGARTDCAGATCTYSEEITNFGNWYAYYRTRMQAMKSAVSLAFQPIDQRYRVGFITIANQSSPGNYLAIDKFASGSGSQKEQWYTTLFNIVPSTSTPLRSALSIVGRIYAGQKPVGNSDPMQYSCQQNFALLTTDGYWNTDSNSAVKGLDGNPVGDLDGGSTSRPMYEGPTASSNTLADVAKYYYDTDLRNSKWNNCTGAAGVDVCEDNVFVSGSDNNVKQHMTTFTLGLGVDGTLAYASDYKTATSGDYYNLVNGLGSPVVNWPAPVADTETAVDDLWHAAVNGGGTYFSAKDPAQLSNGLNAALASIGAKLGAGAAAATSTLNPVAGDNFAYVASYTTVKWQGNLEARTVNVNSGVVAESATWCAENIVAGSCPAPGSIVADTSGGSTVYNCVTPGATAATCSGTLDGSNCKVSMPVACTGTMASKVGGSSDSRIIKMADGNGGLADFTYANLSATQKAYFTGTSLSQWSLFDATQKTAAGGANLVNFLRGQSGYEDRTSNVAANRLYRYREATLGDALESQPAFVGKPYFNYTDAGYGDFVTANASRPRTVYIGTNDGMLHAFNADNGTERWAYVPSMVMPNLWKLADKNYSTMHTNYVNGRPIIGDVCPKAPASTCSKDEWKTILVAGLNGGGRGYYALDVTDPTSPTFLWEIDSGTDSDLGYTYGPPLITKKGDGTWVVLLTSGYNNTNPGNGQGYLYVRNAMTGAAISKIGTGVGDTTTPSGLGKVGGWGDDPNKNNTTLAAYAGDLMGNLWRFDIDAGTVMKFAVLKDPGGATQPITTRPEMTLVNDKRMIYVATGKYLEVADLTNNQVQTLYAIMDDNVTSTLVDPRPQLVQQQITASGATRTATVNAVDLSKKLGWYADLPDTGERNNIDPMLDSGLLLVPTTVPSNTVCSPGGYGWLNYFNYKTGNNGVNAIVSQKFNAPIVGINVLYTQPDPSNPTKYPGGRSIGVVTAIDPTPEQPKDPLPPGEKASGFAGKRVIWRELIPD